MKRNKKSLNLFGGFEILHIYYLFIIIFSHFLFEPCRSKIVPDVALIESDLCRSTDFLKIDLFDFCKKPFI